MAAPIGPTASLRHALAGTIHLGAPADLTILAADPAHPRLDDFTHVRYTIRDGRILYDPNSN